MVENISENPALNPTRKWEDDPEVRMHLRFITKNRVDHVNLLKRLLEGPIDDLNNEDVERVVFLNKIAEAYGYINLIIVNGNRSSLDPGARKQLSTVLSAEYRGGM
ncbi:hypothetical protein [Umezawaea sp. Da 62-37]|uniref:hypothetical protein n=1 Tax=Umezawaea sp. Da 62-37 TaxID=3075927 RepID=UPI0028F6D293|nr:hypothetical protein [Umezawaea sp. Da 62-37]WNV83965.1 hypothetical protein RM788_38250 [Umezawaea sp. Da 62-37]